MFQNVNTSSFIFKKQFKGMKILEASCFNY